MSGRVSFSRWTNHPAVHVCNLVFLMRDIAIAALAVGGLIAGALAHQDTLSIVALALAALALTGVVASSVTAQRRPAGFQAAGGAGAGLPFEAGQGHPPRASDEQREELVAQEPASGTVAGQVNSGRQLRAQIRSAQERGAWDDEGWAYRKRVETWTERTAEVLEECGRRDLAKALAEVEVAPQPPFESLLKGYSASYARLVGLLDGRLDLLERSLG
jgi:hypothetical protein